MASRNSSVDHIDVETTLEISPPKSNAPPPTIPPVIQSTKVKDDSTDDGEEEEEEEEEKEEEEEEEKEKDEGWERPKSVTTIKTTIGKRPNNTNNTTKPDQKQ